MRTVSLIVATILVLDQITKVLISHLLVLHESVPVLESFFHLTYERNTGAAFSLLAQAPAWFRQPFFLLTTAVAIVALIVFLWQTDGTNRLLVVAIAAVLGGAVGNLIDRILYGEVIDFLLFHWRGYYWPAFNVADSCITLGVIGLLWSSLQEHRADKKYGHFAS
ncbi:MAG TPA: signal peptidase II [Candidatus Binatia bacterium]|jgi:signal peptidase II|nr:signal peptidase II [Candidatus Binatia bacterium]